MIYLTTDVLRMLMLYCFEPVLYVDSVAKFPETTEKPGFYLVFADNVGDALTFENLKNDLSTVLHGSVVRLAADPTHRNKIVTCNSDVQKTLDKLDNIPGAAIPNINNPKQRSRYHSDEVSNRTRSKTGNIDQNIGDRTRSKVQFIHNSGFQGNIFLFMMQSSLKTR
jgi:hypothetical protein